MILVSLTVCLYILFKVNSEQKGDFMKSFFKIVLVSSGAEGDNFYGK